MIRFANKPDEVFTEIITRSLKDAISEIALDLEEESDELTSNYFSDDFISSFGGAPRGIKIIHNELNKIKAAHESKDLYMVTDVHFKMLYDVIKLFCDTYAETLAFCRENNDNSYSIICKGKEIESLDFEDICTAFFWDTDFNMSEEVSRYLFENKAARNFGDFGIQSLNIALNMPVDFSDLQIEKSEADENWYRNEEYDYLWFSHEEHNNGSDDGEEEEQ
ncbi:MAG: hypothetical protein JW795_11275 [Chitinivibrionales bacterium]|nr:hypothetical protein [Chitinivibrionales bacterium]